jgi:aminoglycoside phosphotransferase (APT) family kinase protein
MAPIPADLRPALEAFTRDRRAVFYPKADSGLHADPPAAPPDEVIPALPRLVEAHLGEAPVAVEVLGEAFTYHRVFRVALAGGRELVARVNAYSHRTRDFCLELDRWAAAALRRAGLPAVGVLAVDLSRSLCPWDFALLERADGVPLRHLDADESAVVAHLRGLGKLLAGLHKIRLDGFGLLTIEPAGSAGGVCRSWREYLTNHLDRHVEVCRAIGAVTADEAAAARAAFADARLDDVPAALLHGDPGGHNVFVRGGAVTGLIDWEDAVAGDPAYELAFCASFHPERRHPALFDGYFGGRQPGADFWGRFWLYFLRVALAKTVVRHNLGLTDVPGRPPASLRIQRGLRGLLAARAAA